MLRHIWLFLISIGDMVLNITIFKLKIIPVIAVINTVISHFQNGEQKLQPGHTVQKSAA